MTFIICHHLGVTTSITSSPSITTLLCASCSNAQASLNNVVLLGIVQLRTRHCTQIQLCLFDCSHLTPSTSKASSRSKVIPYNEVVKSHVQKQTLLTLPTVMDLVDSSIQVP